MEDDQTSRPESKITTIVAAATVLYNPDGVVLDRLLDALDQKGRCLFIFVNGPLSGGIEARLTALANATILRSETNVGLGAGLNAVALAARAQGHELLVLFDQDSEPDPDLIENLRDRFFLLSGAPQRLAALAPYLTTPVEGNWRSMRYEWRRAPQLPSAVYFAPTSGCLISLAAFQEIGPFRADFFIGGIDVEWGLRAWSHGYGSAVATDITMVHRWGVVESEPNRRMPQILRQSDVRTFYYVRNGMACLAESYIPVGWRIRFAARLLGQALLLLLRRRFDRVLRRRLWRAAQLGVRGRLGIMPAEFDADRPDH